MRVGPALTLGVLGVATIGIGRFFGLIEMFVLGTALVAASILAIVVTRSRIVLVEITRRTTAAEPRVGDDVGVEVRIRATRRSPEFLLRDRISDSSRETTGLVDISIPPLRMNQETLSRYRVRAESRGVITLGPAAVEHGDPFGLARSSRPVGVADEIIVAPPWRMITMPDPRESDGDLVDAIRDLTRNLAIDREFRSLREYVQGDDSRNINWRATARRDSLIINEYESRADVLLDVVVDDDSSAISAEGFERAVCIAASFVGSAALSDDDDVRVRLSIGEPHEKVFFDSLIDESSRREAMKALSLVTSSDRAFRPRKGNSTSTVSIPVFICGHRPIDWIERSCRMMNASSIAVVIACDASGTFPAPERWFVVDGSDLGTFAASWSVLSHPIRRR